MSKVDFIIIGVQKGGTSSAIHHLNTHPNIHIHPEEIHFFDEKLKYNKGIEYYHSCFKGDINKIPSNIKVGEKTPSLSYNPNAIKRIKDYNKDIKLFLFLREPMSRVYSQWNMYTQIGFNVGSFREFITNNFLTSFKDIEWNGYYPLQRSLYITHIQNILDHFPKSQLHITISEELKTSPLEHYNNIFKFLKLDPLLHLDFNENIHKRSYESSILIEDFKFLYNIFKPYNEQLYNFLGRDIPLWEKTYNQIIN